MRTAAVARLKASLSQYLGWVKEGEEILVTDRGRPVAKIIPIDPQESSNLQDMQKRGLLKLGTGLLSKDFWSIAAPGDKDNLGLSYLLEEREQGR